MRALQFWKAVTMDRSDFLDRLLAALEAARIDFCVIGGTAVNAYAAPVVTLDLDIAVALADVEKAEERLAREFKVHRFAHSVNVSAAGSDLSVQIQTDPRYAAFVERARRAEVLGLELPVAAVEDVLQGKIWAAQDPERRRSKQLKDLSDIARLVETYPALRERVPAGLLAQISQ
jgi:hypothetical protein